MVLASVLFDLFFVLLLRLSFRIGCNSSNNKNEFHTSLVLKMSVSYEYVYFQRMPFCMWAGELVCGFRTQKLGFEETPPTSRIAAP